MNLNAKILRKAKPAVIALAILVLLSCIQAVLILVQAKILSMIISFVFLQGASLDGVWIWMKWLLFLILLRGIVTWGSESAAADVAVRVKSDLRTSILTHIHQSGKEFIDQTQTGELIAVLNDSVEALDGYLSQYIPQLILAVLIPILILAFVIPLDLLTAIVFFLTLPLMPMFMYLIGTTAERIVNQQWEALTRMRSFFIDTLQGLRTLITFNQQDAFLSNIHSISENYRQVTLKILRITFLSAFALEFIATISTALVAVETGLRLLDGKLLFETALVIILIAPEYYLPLRQLGMRFHAGITGKTAIDKIFSILEKPLPQQGRQSFTPGLIIDGKLNIPSEISFREVTYRYPTRDKDAVWDITFAIQSGEKMALVGPSGSGKTTLLYLLLQMLRPTGGIIAVDGMDLAEISQQAWRDILSWVPQKPHIFYGTIYENIVIGKPQAKMTDVVDAAKKAHLHDFIQTLTMKYDTWIGENGIFLSGGQMQRIALARAFIKNSPIILLDEPTSNVDPELEEQLQQSFNLLSINRTMVTIAHRMSTVYQADRIIVLDKGKIVESGNHTELISQKGFYSRMITLRQGGKE